MQKQKLWGYEVEIDREATLAWYEQAQEWGCDCGHCRNFLALAKARKLPPPVMETMEKLGIPLEKATYVCGMHCDETGMIYQFSYRIAGNILAEPNEAQGMGRCCHELYPYGSPNFPEPHFDAEFWTVLPWVLEESPDGEGTPC